MAGFPKRGIFSGSDDAGVTPRRGGAGIPSGVDKPGCGWLLPAWVSQRPSNKPAPSPRAVVNSSAVASTADQDSHSILPKRLLTVRETASFFQVSEKTIRRLIARRELAVVQLGRSIRIDPEVIEKIVRQNE